LGAVLPLGKLELAAVLKLGVDRFRLGGSDIGLGLLNQGLILDLLDLVEQLAGFHVLAFAEQHLFEKALDAGAQLDLVGRLDVADEFEGLADALLRYQPHTDGRRRRRRCRSWRRGPHLAQQEPAAAQDDRHSGHADGRQPTPFGVVRAHVFGHLRLHLIASS
jgi:hypothetical protein